MDPLAQVVGATVAFVGTHFLMSHPLRAPMVVRLGERGFLGIYSLVSLALFGWLIWEMLQVGPEPILWAAPHWAWLVGGAIMLVASIFLVGSLIRNPALPGMPAGAGDPQGVLAITRHPMMWAFALWAAVHAALWPQPSVLVLCAGIALLALAGAAGQDVKKSRLRPGFWPTWRAKTAFVPFTGPALRQSWWPGWGVLLGGVALWLLATWLHPFFGAPAVGIWAG